MDHAFTVSCDVAGGLVVLDESVLRAFGEAEGTALGFVLDPEGKSDIARDIPPDEWAATRTEHGAPFLRHCQAGRALIDILDGGEFSARIYTAPLPGPQPVLETHTFRLALEGGLVALEASALVESLMFGEHPARLATIALPAGAYDVTLHHLGQPASEAPAIQGVYWGTAGPAIHVSVTPAADVSVPTTNVAHLTRATLDASARGHRLQRAVVRRVEAGRALLEILVSRNVRSGFAEAPLPPHGVAPGSTVVIDIVGQEGGRALARVVGPA